MLESLIKEQSRLFFEEIREIRRQLHQHPELSFEEHNTAALIEQRLQLWGIEHKIGIAGTGVIAEIRGAGSSSGHCVALRADMDALPIEEDNECSYKSQNKGIMHACGHDAHVAMLLGAIKILNNIRSHYSGTIRFIFQPGEERLPGGAKYMIEAGALKDVDYIIAQHCYPDLPIGTIGLCSGPYMASCNEINITISGRGGHAAKPDHCSDMVWIASKIIVELEAKMRASATHDNTPYLLRFGHFIANGSYNIVPNTITIKGTFRTYNEAFRQHSLMFIKSFVEEEAAFLGATAMVEIEDGYPFLLNDNALKQRFEDSAAAIIGRSNIITLKPLLTSEDFAWYSHQVPALFYRIGTSNKDKGIIGQQHTSTFDIDEEALRIGTALLVKATTDILNS